MNRNFALLRSLLMAVTVALFAGCSGPPDLSTLPADELFSRGMEEYKKKKYLKSLQYFQTLVYNFPGETVVDSAQYFLAMSYLENEEYLVAEREFNRLQLNYPSSVFAVHSQFMRAVCLYEGTPKHEELDQSELTLAIEQFEDFIMDHPESEVISDAKEYLLNARTRLAKKYFKSGIVYVRIRRYGPARTYFQKVVDDFTDTEYATRASYQLAEIDYVNKDFGEALRRYGNFLAVFPDHELAREAARKAEDAAFKWAEAAFRDGDHGQARQRFEMFLNDYAASKRRDKANKYLEEISAMLPPESVADSTGSENEG